MNTFFNGPFENGLFTNDKWKTKSALVLVPHQDDEINLAGATIRNLVNHGINIYVLFCTTCNRLEPAELRAAEGIRSCRILGVPEKHIFFLGYCNDPHTNENQHCYNAPDNTPATNSRKVYETFTALDRPEWCLLHHKTHHTVTRGNLRDDITDVLLTLKPDLVFAVDFDRHPDHRAVSLLFDEAVGNILKRPGNTYFPEIYKGFAYNGSYLGARDFYDSLNLKGEVKAEGSFSNNAAFDTDFPSYSWQERVRLPLPRETLSRTLNGNFLYNAVRAHFSQGMLHNAKRIFNSDQIFWHRRTDAVSYAAKISVSSGNALFLNDFKLADCADILALPAIFGSGTWVPDHCDKKKEARIEFPEPMLIQRVTLYGNAEETSRILKGKIIFSSGTIKYFGPLAKGAAANHIDLDRPEYANWLKVQLIQTEGPAPGLTELQVYTSREPDLLLQFIKIMIDDIFAYDYLIQKQRPVPLQLYCFGSCGVRVFEQVIPDKYKITCICPEHYKMEGLILYPGPKFTKAVIRIEAKADPSVYDQVVIRKITLLQYIHLKIVQAVDTARNRIEHVVKNKYYKLFIKENSKHR